MPCLVRIVVFVFFSVALSCSQTAVVTRRVNLRPDPSTSGTPIDKLTPSTQVQVIESEPTNGFLHVKFNDEVGWVWSKSVKVQAPPSTGGDNSRSGVASGGGSSTVGGTSNGGAPENSISADWEKPTPQTSSFESDEGTCQATGDGGDSGTNQRKNRTDVPASYHPVTWNAINTLNYAKGAPKSRMEWTPDELATITPVEGAAITVEGFLYKVKVESSTPNSHGGESTNCHAHLATDVDWHMPLTANLGDGENAAVIVETTPRVRKQHPQWTTARLKSWTAHIRNNTNPSYNQQKVRISGWLMLDPEHQDMIDRGLRSTLWEIHPITRIELFDNGNWIDVDNQ